MAFNTKIISTLIAALLISCTTTTPTSPLKSALTFYASFDEGVNADFALGDANMYTASSRRALDSASIGMNNPDHSILANEGVVGDAFKFGAKSSTVVFYKSKDNINHSTQNWSGSISFWLRLDPATDLEPGFTDPIQVTDTRYDDAAIWVDFTRENPRNFRMGILGDQVEWHKDTVATSRNEEYEKRLVTIPEPPFSKDAWTHIVLTYEALGTSNSVSTMYMNGINVGEVRGIDDPFTWDVEKSNIYLGLSFIGLMDELAIFNRTLTADQVAELYALENGIKSIL